MNITAKLLIGVMLLVSLILLPASVIAQDYIITGASVDTSKVRITGVKKRTPPAQTVESTNERVSQPFYSPAPAVQNNAQNYGTYSVAPPKGQLQEPVSQAQRYAPQARKGVLITNDMGVDKPKKAKAANISSVRGLAQACRHVILAQNGRAYDERSYGLCYGYIRGIKNSYDIQYKVTKKGQICFPKNVTWLQIIKVYLKWADQHPEAHHRIAWEGTVKAMKASFPCLTR